MPKVEAYESSEAVFGFDCPGCHMSHALPTSGPRAWSFNGNLDKPTFRPSILAREYDGDNVVRICHSFVTDGNIQFLGDCTHELAGKTVEIPEVS